MDLLIDECADRKKKNPRYILMPRLCVQCYNWKSQGITKTLTKSQGTEAVELY